MKWMRKALEDVADFCLGKMLDQKKNKGDLRPYLANVNVRWGEFAADNLREMRFEQHELERFGLKYGDIVMCEGGEPGRCAIWKNQIPGMMIQKAIHRIRPTSAFTTISYIAFFFIMDRPENLHRFLLVPRSNICLAKNLHSLRSTHPHSQPSERLHRSCRRTTI